MARVFRGCGNERTSTTRLSRRVVCSIQRLRSRFVSASSEGCTSARRRAKVAWPTHAAKKNSTATRSIQGSTRQAASSDSIGATAAPPGLRG